MLYESYDSFVRRNTRFGQVVKSVSSVITIDKSRSIVFVTTKGSSKFKGGVLCFEAPKTDLEKCPSCGRYSRRNRSAFEFPWMRRLCRDIPAHIINKFVPYWYSCAKCMGVQYRVLKIEHENIKTKESIASLRKEIKCQSRQPEI